jgi:hypothetical protein
MTSVCGFLGEDFDSAIVTDGDRRSVSGASTAESDLADRVRQPITSTVTESSRGALSSRALYLIDFVVARYLPAVGYARPPRRNRAIGAVLNLGTLPSLLTRRLRQRADARRTPQERYDAFVQAERERVERFAARRRALRGR